jgi:hypothetical protein
MQQAYFRSDGQSQTRSVREAALAAHYVLKHNNRDALPLDQVCASAAVAAVRGQIAFIALAGDASAFAWRSGRLSGHYTPVRLARPLGLEPDPGIALWSTRLESGDRLLLVSGAEGHADASDLLEEILSSELSVEATEQQVSEALGSGRPAGALVVEAASRQLRSKVICDSSAGPNNDLVQNRVRRPRPPDAMDLVGDRFARARRARRGGRHDHATGRCAHGRDRAPGRRLSRQP